MAPPEGWALPEQGGPLDGAAAALSPNELLNQLLGFCGGGAAGAAGAAPRPGGAAGRGGHPAAAAGPAPGLPLGGGTPTALAGVKGTLGDSDVSTLSGCSGPGVSAARGAPQAGMLRCAPPSPLEAVCASTTRLYLRALVGGRMRTALSSLRLPSDRTDARLRQPCCAACARGLFGLAHTSAARTPGAPRPGRPARAKLVRACMPWALAPCRAAAACAGAAPDARARAAQLRARR